MISFIASSINLVKIKNLKELEIGIQCMQGVGRLFLK